MITEPPARAGRNTRARRLHRHGLSLLELLVVLTLLGIFTSAAFMHLGRDVFGDAGARSHSRLMSLGLLHAQRAAIRTGDPHGLIVQGSTADVRAWTVVRRYPDASQEVVDGPHEFPQELTVSVNSGEMWFDFEGSGSQLFRVLLTGPHRAFEIEVEPLTRMIRTQETTP